MKRVKTSAILIISVSVIFVTILGETSGGKPFPTNETSAATFSWGGKFPTGNRGTGSHLNSPDRPGVNPRIICPGQRLS